MNTKNNSKVDYCLNDNWHTGGYGELIFGLLWPMGVRLMVRVLVIGFVQNIRGCNYYIIILLCRNYVIVLFYVIYLLY